MPDEAPAHALVRMGNQFLLSQLFVAAGPLAAAILQNDPDLDPASEEDIASAFRQAVEAVANEFGRMSPKWCEGSKEPVIAKLLTALIARGGRA